MTRTTLTRCAAATIALSIGAAAQATTINFNAADSWGGFMNVFELPSSGGGYVFGQPWGVPDLTATFNAGTVRLGATPIATSDAFWYVGGVGGPGVPGNKNMEAILNVNVTGGLSGQTVTFTGTVVSNTFVAPYQTFAFVRDFAPDFSSFNESIVPLSGPGAFSVSLATLPAPGRNVQYGFLTRGPNVWPTDAASKGFITIAPIPEPATLGAIAAGAVMALRRRRN